MFLLALPRFLEGKGVWFAVLLAELFTHMLTVYLICRQERLIEMRNLVFTKDSRKREEI